MVTNYLDDFLFLAIAKLMCDQMIKQFLALCEELHVPVAMEKTEWGGYIIIFLGILLNGKCRTLSLPLEKRDKALRLLNDITGKKRATVKELQSLTGYLNFLTKAIFAGRMFTCRMYVKFASMKLKRHHHVRLDGEFKLDCEIWRTFLANHEDTAVCRPMVDLTTSVTMEQLNFYSDARANRRLGFGAVFNNQWLFAQWEDSFIENCKPTIEYLELFAVTAAVMTWGHQLEHLRVIIFCDNQAVVGIINNMSSSCGNCMRLLRLLTLNNLIFNRRIFAKYVRSVDNDLSDALSRLQFNRFWRLAPSTMNAEPSIISPVVWPALRIWGKCA